MTEGQALLYGSPTRRTARSAGWGPATLELPYPRNLVLDDGLGMRMVAADLVIYMPGFGGEEERTIETFVTAVNPRASALPEDRVGYSSPGGALCLLVIERLPMWKEKPEGADSSFHGDHLAVSHWVHDAEARRWYLLARHGRGIYAAAVRPYKRFRTARERMHELDREIRAGDYRIDDKTVPLRHTTRSLILAERAGLIGAAKIGEG